LIDRDNMGHFNAAGDTQIVQSLPNIFPFGTPEPGNYNAPVYFNGTVYFSPVADAVKAFRMSNGLLPTFPTSLLITIMRIFDVYEHPSFEVEQADKTAVRSTIRRLGVGVGVGATVSAIAAISFWYCWLDPSPPSFLLSNTAITHLRWTGFNWSVLSSTGPTSIRGTYHYVLQRGGL